jgi:hypothetical protein
VATDPDDPDDVAGHYRVAGNTLVALGLLAMILALTARLISLDLRFITPIGFAVVGVVFVTSGLWMRSVR